MDFARSYSTGILTTSGIFNTSRIPVQDSYDSFKTCATPRGTTVRRMIFSSSRLVQQESTVRAGLSFFSCNYNPHKDPAEGVELQRARTKLVFLARATHLCSDPSLCPCDPWKIRAARLKTNFGLQEKSRKRAEVVNRLMADGRKRELRMIFSKVNLPRFPHSLGTPIFP